jgi:hypothetical protein
MQSLFFTRLRLYSYQGATDIQPFDYEDPLISTFLDFSKSLVRKLRLLVGSKSDQREPLGVTFNSR